MALLLYFFPFGVYCCLFGKGSCLSWALQHRGGFWRPLNSRETFLAFICWLGVGGWGWGISEPPTTFYALDRCILIPTPYLTSYVHSHIHTHTTWAHSHLFPHFFNMSSQFNHLGKYLFMVYRYYFPRMCWRSCLFIWTVSLSPLPSRWTEWSEGEIPARAVVFKSKSIQCCAWVLDYWNVFHCLGSAPEYWILNEIKTMRFKWWLSAWGCVGLFPSVVNEQCRSRTPHSWCLCLKCYD